QVQTLNTLLRVMRLTQLANYAYATTYKIEVAVYYAGYLQPYVASNCTVTTPIITTSLTNCNQTLSTMSDVIYANNVPYASGYRFSISDGVNTTTLDRSTREFRMSLITAFQPQFNRQYTIQVAVKNTNGQYLPYGSSCTVTTPIFPTTSLQDSQCDDFAPASANTIIYATSYPGAIAYVFNLSGPALPAQGVEITRTTRSFKLSDFSGLIPGATYNVKVRLVFNYNDIAGPYGKICTVVVPGASRMMAQQFNAVAYPNPFADNFSINVTTSADTKVNIKVYDMTGRLLEQNSVEASDVKSLTIGDRFPSGVYNVIVSQGDEVKTLRVVKR
ncbi:MAG: T9SS type A sorting domain-containing protein, partial [Flavobacterium sp.]